MRSLLALAFALVLTLVGLCRAPAASAGPNAGGVLILHANTNLQVSTEPTNYCGQSGLEQCAAAVTSLPGGGPEDQTVWFVLAAFSPEANPRLAGIAFGVNYDQEIVVSYYDGCGDFELSMQNWPASGSGTAITWNSPHTGHLTEIYYFVGYGDVAEPRYFATAPHPTGGGVFADDAVPGNIDPIAAYGVLGFNTPGSLPCGGERVGACCFGGIGGCEVIGADLCHFGDGVYQGDGTNCDPDPCSATPVELKSWGGIKQTYR